MLAGVLASSLLSSKRPRSRFLETLALSTALHPLFCGFVPDCSIAFNVRLTASLNVEHAAAIPMRQTGRTTIMAALRLAPARGLSFPPRIFHPIAVQLTLANLNQSFLRGGKLGRLIQELPLFSNAQHKTYSSNNLIALLNRSP